MRRNSIEQHLSSEGTVYMHAFRNASRSTTTASSGTRSTDDTPSIDPTTINAMIPSLSGA